MINITIEAANGADARQQMLDLLGVGFIGIDIARPGADKSVIATVENGEISDVKEVVEETPKPEQTTRKRRTKAEIEAETLKANTGTEEPPASEENVGETPDYTEDTTTAVVITAEDLTKKAVELGRNGHRDQVLAVLNDQFGGATISKKDGKPTLTADQYEAVMEAFNAIG